MSRWALHCPKCRARLRGNEDRWLLVATVFFLLVAVGALLARSSVLEKFTFSSNENPSPELETSAQPQAPRAQEGGRGQGFSLSVPFTAWKTQDPKDAAWSAGGSEPAMALVRREGLAYGAVFVEPSDLTAEGLALLALDRVKARGEGFELARRESGKLAGEEAQVAEFSLQTGGVEIRYLAHYAAHKGRGYQALFWCFTPDYATYRPEFDKILSSWRWQEDSP